MLSIFYHSFFKKKKYHLENFVVLGAPMPWYWEFEAT